jgi:hypothetical protein
MADEPTVLIDDALALDEERLSELASDFAATLRRVGEARLALDARFLLARRAVERLSVAGVAKPRYKIPLQASFLPPARARFAQAHLVLGLDAHPDLDILAVRPAETRAEVEIAIEDTRGAEASAEYQGLKAGASAGRKASYKRVPIVIRGIGPGSDTAEWSFDGPPEEGGLPTRVDLELEVALPGARLEAAVRMTAGIRWTGILGLLPFVWPKGVFRRLVTIDLPGPLGAAP